MKSFQYKKYEDYGYTWWLRLFSFGEGQDERAVFDGMIEHSAMAEFRITRLAAAFLLGGDALVGVTLIVGNVSINASIWSR